MDKKQMTIILRYLKIVFGGIIYAIGFRMFLFPNSMMAGGLGGLSMIINQLSGLPVGLMTFVMNIPLFIAARKVLGRRFFIGSVVGMTISTLLVDVFGMLLPSFTRDPLLGSIYGGIINGAGIGLVLSAGASTGGSDIIAGLLRHRFPSINFGKFMLMVNGGIIAIYALVLKNYDCALYSVIAIFVESKIIDGILYGFEHSKLVYIISDEYEKISHELQIELHRGVTLIEGYGAYTGQHKNVIMCVIKRQQIAKLKHIVQKYDEHAFVIINETHEVIGKSFANIQDDI